ncbi:hypothetical protein HN011_007629 [Eciton burchellii]|nr:hypothetical protein HN011_007629 [Eciton burchellii]
MNDKHPIEFTEDAEELSITSLDPNERKLARRLRVKQHLEELTKKKGPEDEEIVEKSLTEKQILVSSELLEGLLAEGTEVVSCVRLANDARELQRREKEQEIRRTLLKKLEEDDEECIKKYEEINEKWSGILASKHPLDIHAEMEAQNARCMEIIGRKDAIIAELQLELENADFKFLNDQKILNEDINLLIDRMDNQINVMTKACHRELSLIDNVIESEYKIMLENIKEKWEALYKKLQENTVMGLDMRKEIVRDYEKEMKEVMIDHQEKFRSQKINLELEMQKLQQEIQSTKILCFMNIEKLDYSHSVLKQREEENAIVKNQQKRRLNKLQDIINGLKKEYVQLEGNTRIEIQKLTDQVVKAHKNILELTIKSNHFTSINDKRYMQIWDMNTSNANLLLNRILNTDKIIYEQALRLVWNPPEKTLLKKEDLPSYRNIMHIIKEENRIAAERKIISKSYKPADTIEQINLERRLLNHIIRHVADQCDYLIEDKLLELLLPYTINDQLVVRLDNVFQALKIKSEEELGFLLNFFLPYAYCRICTKPVSNDVSRYISDESAKSTSKTSSEDVCGIPEEFTSDEARLIAAVKKAIRDEELAVASISNDVSVCSFQTCLVEESLSTEQELLTTYEEKYTPPTPCVCINDIIKDTDNDQMQRRLLCNKGHLLEIEATFVTRALREFIEKYHFVKMEEMPQTFQEKLTERKKVISREMTIEDITNYWMRYSEIFSAKKERLWDGLLVGLRKYHEILKKRDDLNIEMEFLRKQNAELRHLLKTYIQPECIESLQKDERSVCGIIE